MARFGNQHPAKTVVVAGVKFMGECAKMLSPQKDVLMPDARADCFMAHMIDNDFIKKTRKEYLFKIF